MNYCGIYKITQKSTNKVYIGKSNNVIRRLEQHLNDNTDDWHKIMQDNLDDWSIEIIEHCEESQLNEREQYWINYYDSYNTGFNRTRGNGPAKSPKLKLQDIEELPNSRHVSFLYEDMDRIFRALMTNSYYETLTKILFINNLLDYDYYKYQFAYAENDVYIIKIMPFKNKKYDVKDTVYICLDLDKKSIQDCVMKDILHDFDREVYQNPEYFLTRRFYYIKNHGGYKCDWFWAISLQDCYSYKKFPIFR